MNRLRAGNDAAWTAWFDASGPRVWKYVARLTGADSSTTADIVQDVFVAASASLDSFDASRGTLTAWLLGIAHRRTARYWQKRKSETQFVDALTEQQVAGIFDAEVGTALQQQEISVAVRSVVARMPEDSANVLVSYYIDGSTTRQIAGEIGVTEQAVRSRLSRARTQFREMFQVAHREFV